MDKFEAKVLGALDKLESEGKIESVPADKEPEGCTMDENGSLIYPKTITETYGEFTFTYYIEPKKEYEKLRFLSRDIFEILSITNPDIDKIIVITDINVNLDDKTKKPNNTNFALREFAEAHSDMLIALQLYVIGKTEEEAIIYKNSTFIELVIDLEEAGFVDINSHCQFENSIAFVYRNEQSRNLLRFIIRSGLRDFDINGIELKFEDYAEEWYFCLPEKFGLTIKTEAQAKEENPGAVLAPELEDNRDSNKL